MDQKTLCEKLFSFYDILKDLVNIGSQKLTLNPEDAHFMQLLLNPPYKISENLILFIFVKMIIDLDLPYYKIPQPFIYYPSFLSRIFAGKMALELFYLSHENDNTLI